MLSKEEIEKLKEFINNEQTIYENSYIYKILKYYIKQLESDNYEQNNIINNYIENSIPKEVIEEKIKECKKAKRKYSANLIIQAQIDILKELLKGKLNI